MADRQQGGAEARRDWDWTERVIGACIEVHRHLGPGLLESAYQLCLEHELRLRDIPFDSGLALPVVYKGVQLNPGYRLDLLVAGAVVVELKAVAELRPVHAAQVITYLRLTGVRVGLLVNFHEEVLRLGIRRFVLNPKPSAPPRLPV